MPWHPRQSKASSIDLAGKTNISPHDLRHTCATARYTMFMELNPDRELAIQRMRAFSDGQRGQPCLSTTHVRRFRTT